MNEIDNAMIFWSDENPVFNTWGTDGSDYQIVEEPNLNLGIFIKYRSLKWIDFVAQVANAVSITSNFPKYKELIALIILISMNKIKAKLISSKMENDLINLIKTGENGQHYVEIKSLEEIAADHEELKKTTDWLTKSDIGQVDEKMKIIYINNYTVKSLIIKE